MTTQLCKHAGIEHPIICGAMYPCSNAELVAAASEAGGIGIVQPLSLVFAHKMDFRDGLKKIRSLTKKPIGMNIITEKSVKQYQDRMEKWLDIALEEGVRFFVTSLGNPRWVVDRVEKVGGIVYHDVTERKWAQKALDEGVKGIICVNSRAGGHAGQRTPLELYEAMKDLKVPLISAGGISTHAQYAEALNLGYDGVQLGTRFIAAKECSAHLDYKLAILKAKERDIVLTEKLSGVPVAVINTDYVKRVGTHAGPLGRFLLKNSKTKHWMRSFYSLQSLFKLRNSLHKGSAYQEYFQAGKSVEGIDSVLSCQEIIQNLVRG